MNVTQKRDASSAAFVKPFDRLPARRFTSRRNRSPTRCRTCRFTCNLTLLHSLLEMLLRSLLHTSSRYPLARSKCASRLSSP
eukprot:6202577-Pleurochrysis_carterae.AAC.2